MYNEEETQKEIDTMHQFIDEMYAEDENDKEAKHSHIPPSLHDLIDSYFDYFMVFDEEEGTVEVNIVRAKIAMEEIYRLGERMAAKYKNYANLQECDCFEFQDDELEELINQETQK